MINAYPLTWPEGWKRTPSYQRQRGHFGKKKQSPGRSYASKEPLTVFEGVTRVLAELERMGISRDDLVISTNVPTRMDGMPRSDARNPEDPGVSVWWETQKQGRKVMAIDLYDRVADNLAAIAATLDAMRAIERHGGAAILDRAFTGFTALEHNPGGSRPWRQVLFPNGAPAHISRALAKVHYRQLAAQLHPDRPGGSHEAMTELNVALQQAEKELAS